MRILKGIIETIFTIILEILCLPGIIFASFIFGLVFFGAWVFDALREMF